jgi:hypothetical protein
VWSSFLNLSAEHKRECWGRHVKPLTLRSLHATAGPVEPLSSFTERTCPGRSALAGGAPIRHPITAVVVADRVAAATAVLARAPVHPELAAGSGVAGGTAVPP